MDREAGLQLLDTIAFPFLPATREHRGAVVEAARNWSFERSRLPADASVVVWGRGADGDSSLAALSSSAVRRELALRALPRRVPKHLRITGVHRLPPRRMTVAGTRARVRDALRSGALVELSSLPSGSRVLDAVITNAGAVAPDGSVHVGAGGAVLVPVVLESGTRAVLRLAPAGTAGDPASVADTLERLHGAGVVLAPRLLGRGRVAGASWAVEQALRGQRPVSLLPALARQIASACAGFPQVAGPPSAPVDDLDLIASRLTDRARVIQGMKQQVVEGLRDLPAVLRHGDLWTGNVLVDRGELTGLVDWDASHPAAAPGADVLQLVAAEARRRARHSLGQAFMERPWRSTMFTAVAAGYWAALGLDPGAGVLDAVGIAWWATEVSGTLRRFPERVADEHWLVANVDLVLARFA